MVTRPEDYEEAGARVARMLGLEPRVEEARGDNGRWYRVYTGSFQNRAEANRAIEGLKAYLRTDWAVPARY